MIIISENLKKFIENCEWNPFVVENDQTYLKFDNMEIEGTATGTKVVFFWKGEKTFEQPVDYPYRMVFNKIEGKLQLEIG